MTQRRRYNYRQIEPDDFCKVFDKYVKQKGLDEEVCIHLILSTLKFGPAEKAELFAVLKVALPDVLSEKNLKSYQIYFRK